MQDSDGGMIDLRVLRKEMELRQCALIGIAKERREFRRSKEADIFVGDEMTVDDLITLGKLVSPAAHLDRSSCPMRNGFRRIEASPITVIQPEALPKRRLQQKA